MTILSTITDGIGSAASTVRGGFSSVANGVTDIAGDAFNATKDFLNGNSGSVKKSIGTTSLGEFIAYVRKNGVARPNRFRVTMPLPKKVLKKMNHGNEGSSAVEQMIIKAATKAVTGPVESSKVLQIMCQVASMPGVNVDTTELKAGGKPRKFAFGLSYEPADFVFLVERDMKEKEIFDYWIKSIVDPKDAKVAFYDDYVTDVTVEHLDEFGNVTHGIILEEAFPVVLTGVELDMGTSNQAVMLRTSFVYRRQVLAADKVAQYALASAPATQDAGILGGFLNNFRPAEIVRDALNGNLSGALTQAADLYLDIKTGNYSEEMSAIFKTVSDVGRKYTGLGARELETVYKAVKGDAMKNGKITQAEKAELGRVIDGLIGQVKSVGGNTSSRSMVTGPATSAAPPVKVYSASDTLKALQSIEGVVITN